MKKLAKGLLVTTLIAGLAFGCYTEHNYTKPNCKVVSVTDKDILIEDLNGNLWAFEGEHSFKTGDKVKMKMFDNGTQGYSKDDVIKKIIKEG